MKLPSTRLIERAAEQLGNDLSTLHHAGSVVASTVVRDTGKLVKQARYGLRNGAARIVDMEKFVASDIRTRPLPYLAIALGLGAFLLYKSLQRSAAK